MGMNLNFYVYLLPLLSVREAVLVHLFCLPSLVLNV